MVTEREGLPLLIAVGWSDLLSVIILFFVFSCDIIIPLNFPLLSMHPPLFYYLVAVIVRDKKPRISHDR